MHTPDPLDQTLSEWKPDPSIPPRFQAEVWSRIQQRETARETHWSSIVIGWFSPKLPTWQFATVATLAMMAVGASIGNLSAAAETQRTRTELAREYAQTIDPYLHLSSRQ